MKYKGTAAIQNKNYIMVNDKDKAHVKKAITSLQNVASVKSLYSTKRAFGVYDYKRDYVMMFDDDCKLALHTWVEAKEKYEFVIEI